MPGVHHIYSGNVRGVLQEHIMQYCCHKRIVFNDQGPDLLHTPKIFRERYIIILPFLEMLRMASLAGHGALLTIRRV